MSELLKALPRTTRVHERGGTDVRDAAAVREVAETGRCLRSAVRRAMLVGPRVVGWLSVVVAAGMLLLPFTWSPDGSESRVAALHGFVVLCSEVFAFHAGLALFVVGLFLVLLRRWWVGVLCLAFGIVHAGPGLWSLVPAGAPAIPAVSDAEPTLTVLSQNLLYSRADLDELAEHVERERPDAIMLQEIVGTRAGEIFDRFGGDYPHVVWPNTHRWGGMLLSRHRFLGSSDVLSGEDGWRINQPVGTIGFAGTPVTLMSVHLPAPNRLRQLVAGPRMTARLGAWVESRSGESMVLAGDFNAPLWTTRMRALREAGLRTAHAEAGGGRGATWPAKTPLRFAPGIRLDQVAFNGDLRCIESRVLGATGSDHRPVLARFTRRAAQ